MSVDVRIYATGSCPYCHMAENLLRRKGVQPRILRVDHNPSLRQEMLRLSQGRRTVPQVFIGDRHVGGFDDLSALERQGRLDALLADTGLC
ncbi:MAG: glutaredoxin 3 [Acidithiobacillus sp.]